MSFRASLKNLIRRDPAASLRERATDLRDTLPNRRTVVAGSLVAAVPLPAIGSPPQISAQEAAFLALIPEALPILRRLIPAQAEMNRLDIEADTAAGRYPGPYDEGRRRAWADRASELRKTNGFSAAWDAVNILEDQLTALVGNYDLILMRAPTAILFKVALNSLGEWWGESAVADLNHLAIERFDLSDGNAPAA